MSYVEHEVKSRISHGIIIDKPMRPIFLRGVVVEYDNGMVKEVTVVHF